MNILFWQKSPPEPPTDPPIYGVNLGGWLLLEKWMTPSLFNGTDALDEYTLCESADDAVRQRIETHRESFITLADFKWLKEQGVTAVRLPVGYGVFGDEPPYLETIQYVDKAFEWAAETGLRILLDMHAAPGSQNGKQESGRIGDIGWPREERNIIRTLQVVERLTKRYRSNPALLGIELLNEPHSKIRRRTLLRYYEAAYGLIRDVCGPDVWVVFSDNFKPRRWKRKLRAPAYANTYIDTHRYQTYSRGDKRLDLAGHLKKTLGKESKLLAKMARRHPVIVGEWSLVLNPQSLQGLDEAQLEAARRAYGAAQLIAYARTSAWFYWSYKTEEPGQWSFRTAIEKGWLPRLGDRKKA